MNLAIGSDHAGYSLKKYLLREVLEPAEGIQVEDVGTNSNESVDYPDFAKKVAENVTSDVSQCGVLICGTGIGMSMTANKYPNIRAVNATNSYMAKMSRRHNDSNILCLGSRNLGKELASEILEVWIEEDFSGGRHKRRVGKITRNS